ncbi:MAG: sterol desaturase family protein [Gemmatimonadaceae bacterium]|nr:sterol desaturase family protein [Acetobacteraceae bacterium]
MFATWSAWADWAWYYVLIALFLGLSLWEAVRPAREPGLPVAGRWATNLGLHAASAIVLTVVLPSALADALVRAAGLDWHPLKHVAEALGDWPALLGGILLFDLYAYGMHRIQHTVFPLWRLHAVHHADTEMDASTTLRHHPLEVLVSSGIGVVLFALIGLPEWIAPIYALIGITVSMVQHVNAGRPGRVDQALQAVLVTPGMHQVHHSADARDHDSNYGTVFSIWDRMFGTYRATPARGRAAMTYGIEGFTDPSWAAPRWGLLLPLRIRRERAADTLPLPVQAAE